MWAISYKDFRDYVITFEQSCLTTVIFLRRSFSSLLYFDLALVFFTFGSLVPAGSRERESQHFVRQDVDTCFGKLQRKAAWAFQNLGS